MARPKSPRPKKARQMKSKVKTMLIIFFDLFTKNSSWQTNQSIRYTTVTFYGDCVIICENFAPNFGHKRS
jgi:hypothetical protein